MKRKCAKEACKLIKKNMVVGLGGGSTINFMIENLKKSKIKVVTPSYKTALACKLAGIEVLPTWLVDHVDIAFDGCDEVDHNLNALKSGGAIHTSEKIIGSMADEYILLVDESKVSERLTFNHPVVVEVIKEAYSSVARKLNRLGAKVQSRTAPNKDGMIISDHGNIILETYFNEVEDVEALNKELLMMPGVIDTSLFVGIATSALVVDENGNVRKLEKE